MTTHADIIRIKLKRRENGVLDSISCQGVPLADRVNRCIYCSGWMVFNEVKHTHHGTHGTQRTICTVVGDIRKCVR